LRRADVRRRFVTADVLLSGLKCKTVARLTLRVDRDTNEATRHFTFKLIRAGHESGVWSTKTEGNAKALAVSDANIGTKLTRSTENGKRENVGSHDGECACRVCFFNKISVVFYRAKGVRILKKHTK